MVSKKSLSRRRSPLHLSIPADCFYPCAGLATAGGFAQKSRKTSGPTRSISGGSERNKTPRGRNRASNTLNRTTSGSNVQDPITGVTVGVPITGERGIQRTTTEIMQAQQVAPPSSRPPLRPEHEIEGREDRPQNPDARPVASLPDLGVASAPPAGNAVVAAADLSPSAPQLIGLNFNAVTGPTETGGVSTRHHGCGWPFSGLHLS